MKSGAQGKITSSNILLLVLVLGVTFKSGLRSTTDLEVAGNYRITGILKSVIKLTGPIRVECPSYLVVSSPSTIKICSEHKQR